MSKILVIILTYTAITNLMASSLESIPPEARSILHVSSSTLQRVEKKMFADNGAMAGFTPQNKGTIKQSLLTLPINDGHFLLNLFDYNGALHGFTESNKVKIFQRVSIDAAEVATAFSLLYRFDYQGSFHTFSESNKMALLEASRSDKLRDYLIPILNHCQEANEEKIIALVKEALSSPPLFASSCMF